MIGLGQERLQGFEGAVFQHLRGGRPEPGGILVEGLDVTVPDADLGELGQGRREVLVDVLLVLLISPAVGPHAALLAEVLEEGQ